MKRLAQGMKPQTVMSAAITVVAALLLFGGPGATSAFGQTCSNSIDDA